jgi:hypothetical protein
MKAVILIGWDAKSSSALSPSSESIDRLRRAPMIGSLTTAALARWSMQWPGRPACTPRAHHSNHLQERPT